MTKRSEHSKAEIKALAITAGHKIMGDRGIKAFSMRAVARHIGYSVGTLYHIFKDYDDIVLHINAVTLDEMNRFILDHQRTGLQSKEAIKLLAACYLEFAITYRAHWSALFEYSAPENASPPDWYAKKIGTLLALVEDTIHPITQNKKDADLAARTIWASVHGICILGLTGKLDLVGEERMYRLIDNLVEHYLAGLEDL